MTSKWSVGQRVTALRYGTPELGTVTRTQQGVRTRETDGAIVWVRWDESGRETWMHAASLTPA
jgi:hypothetical protein